MLIRLLAVALILAATPRAGQSRVSEFGRYEGYGEPLYDAWTTNSLHVAMRDGVRLAVDVTRPAVDGKPVATPYPAVWTHSRYHRNPSALIEMQRPGAAEGIDSMVDVMDDLQRLVRHGYVVVAVGVRGSGASFGRYEGLFSPAETSDAVEIIEWIAEQPWCDGNVGMFGGSYLGITQYMAASRRPEALKAIFPNVAALDLYEVIYPGGVYREDMIDHWGRLTREMDTSWPAPPVDGDRDGAVLAAAKKEHADNWDVLEGYRASPFRDSSFDGAAYSTHNAAPFLEDVKAAAVPAYHWNGWFDVFVTDAVLWYANYEAPQRLTIGAWSHGGTPDAALQAERARLRSVEQHRWFDRWLKGVDNGVEAAPTISYAVIVHPGEWTWRTANAWPLPEASPTRYYFAAGPSGSVESVNDGILATSAPLQPDGGDRYAIDPTTTSGSSSRWDNAVGAGPMVYRDMTSNDAKALTWTTPTLANDVTVTGHPIVTLWITSTATDANIHVLLEEIDAQGVSHYVTEGVLRASLRATSEAPWNNLGLPWQRCFERDRADLVTGTPTELRLDLHPTSTVFNAGHRIRVVVMGADADNTEAPPFVDERPTIEVLRNATHASGLLLPVIQEED